MIKHNVRRKKKTAEQVEYLKELYYRLDGMWDGKVRKEAMRRTGLSRIQIYKWFFDMKLQ
jgi:G:T-mismatch repair DNA endonuclease (very short patch repair protein)